MRPRIWVTQEADHDFREAEEWGDITFLTADDVSNIKSSIKNTQLILSLREQLVAFNPDKDFICPAGSPYVLAVVMFLLGERSDIRVLRFLRWSNRDKEYSPIQLDMRG